MVLTMSEQMSRMQAVKKYLSKDVSRPVENAEFLAFWKMCDEPTRDLYGAQAAKLLGAELDGK